MLDIELLSELCRIPGAPGYEQRIRSFIMDKVRDYVDDMYTDALGNILAVKRGTGDKKVMVAAHMDEIAFIVSHIDDDGFIRFHPLGGFDPKTLTAQRVLIHSKGKDILGVMGTKPIHVLSQQERGKAPRIQDFFIDTGLKAEQVKKWIEIGSPITRERAFVEMGDCVNVKSLDNRVSVYVLIETLKLLKDQTIPYDLYAAFTVQEEVGIRGATTATSGVEPDFGIALDVTLAYDLPGASPHEYVSKLGAGTAIKILDGRTICDYRMVEYMKEVAIKNDIKYQLELLPAGGTDTAALQRAGKGGSIAGAISIPTRYLHQVIEMAHKDDIQRSIIMLEACIKGLEDFDWSFK